MVPGSRGLRFTIHDQGAIIVYRIKIYDIVSWKIYSSREAFNEYFN